MTPSSGQCRIGPFVASRQRAARAAGRRPAPGLGGGPRPGRASPMPRHAADRPSSPSGAAGAAEGGQHDQRRLWQPRLIVTYAPNRALPVFPHLSPPVAPANYSVGTRPGNAVFRNQTRFEPHPNVRGLRTEHSTLGYRIAELDVGTLKGRRQILEATQSLFSLCTEEALAITADLSLNICNRVSATIDHHCGQILDTTANRLPDVACCRAHRSVRHNNLDGICLG